MQNSLRRLLEGVAIALLEDVLPTVSDPYAQSQVRAASELVSNLATRVEWRQDQVESLVARVVDALAATGRDAPPRTGDPVEDRRSALAALAAAATGDVADPVRAAIVEDLEVELARLRTGMYR